MKRKKMTVVAAGLLLALSVSACGKEETTTTFTGDTKEEPAYQSYLNAISPSVYSSVEDLDLEAGTYISIIGKESSSEFWTTVEEGVEQAASDLNEALGYSGSDKIKVLYNAPDDGEDIDEQVNILDEELARYPDVVGIASIDADACSVQFDLATGNGIPIIALDSGNNYQGIQCTVKTDNAEAARTGAYKLADEIGDSGEVILIVHDSKTETGQERAESFLSEMEANHSNITVVETIYCDQLDDIKKQMVREREAEAAAESTTSDSTTSTADTSTDTADSTATEESTMTDEEVAAAAAEITDEEVVAYYLEKYPNLKGMFGTNETTTQLALDVLQSEERIDSVVLMGFDAGEDQISALEEGYIKGLAVQNPFGIGYASVVAAARTVLQIGNEAEVDTGFSWVTQDNLEEESIQAMLY